MQLLTKFFVPPNDDDDAKEANFVLVGPVDSKKQSKSCVYTINETCHLYPGTTYLYIKATWSNSADSDLCKETTSLLRPLFCSSEVVAIVTVM